MPVATSPKRVVRLLLRLVRTRAGKALILLLCLFQTFELLYIRHCYWQSLTATAAPGRAPQRIYIASIHWNNEGVLKEYWNRAVVELAEALGPKNVFISVYESGSWDDSKGALKDLDQRLATLDVPRNISLSSFTHLDEISQPPVGPGWIDTARGRKELRRIPYLARLRNIGLEQLEGLYKEGVKFDKILFLNDVVFTVQDVLNLLNTNGGDYAAACSLDFSNPPFYYDTFALRDSEGHEPVMQSWPYFRSRKSRHALKSNMPVPVSSCWNGMVAMPAEPFVLARKLRFRGTEDSLAAYHLEGSECCLIHADNPLSRSAGVFVNPNVRVGYNGDAYAGTHHLGGWISSWQILSGLWENRISRWMTTPLIKEGVVSKRVRSWRRQDRKNTEPGEFCLINEMQVLVENGWAHV